MEKQRLPIVASLMAVGSGVVWSFGGITAREASHSDAFQYMLWRSVGIIAVIEVMSALQGNRPEYARDIVTRAGGHGNAVMPGLLVFGRQRGGGWNGLWRSCCCAHHAPGQPPSSASQCSVFSLTRWRCLIAAHLSHA